MFNTEQTNSAHILKSKFENAMKNMYETEKKAYTQKKEEKKKEMVNIHDSSLIELH